jgi:hypothetical protein
MKLFTLLMSLATVVSALLGGAAAQGQKWEYKDETANGPVEAQFRQTKDTLGKSLDIPRVLPRPDLKSFDLWYFDAVNPANFNESVVIIFYLATTSSFPLHSGNEHSISADVFFTFGDGYEDRLITVENDGMGEGATSATITSSSGLGVSASWIGCGLDFNSSADGKQYSAKIRNSRHGLYGEFNLMAVCCLRCTLYYIFC